MTQDNQWQNRIIGYKQIPACDLLANPDNARRHPSTQRDALRGSLDTLGWSAPVIVSARSQFLLDGHARVEEAIIGIANHLITKYPDKLLKTIDGLENEQSNGQAASIRKRILEIMECD